MLTLICADGSRSSFNRKMILLKLHPWLSANKLTGLETPDGIRTEKDVYEIPVSCYYLLYMHHDHDIADTFC